MWTYIAIFVDELKSRWKAMNNDPEAGYASEAVLVTALLVLGAIVVIAIIVAKVTNKANEIDLGWLAQSVVP
ncbi:hypothetical protein [Actinophytocola sp.]|uniref:hypothetical protein n=1 Tax=Actinophytocola sp. TaxID=1872138 RepID=UPI003D6B56B4